MAIHKGQSSNDSIRGSARNDKLYGKLGNDTLIGGKGDDSLWGGLGNDFLKGGSGDDTLWGGFGNDILKGHKGNDRLYGEDGNDQLYGGKGADRLYGGNGHDYLDGGAGRDWLDGGEGNDTLWGGQGSDTLWGGNGHDTLIGGEGADALYGGDGNDTYIFGPNFGNDTLIDSSGIDKIDFNQISADLTVNFITGLASSSQGSVWFSGIEVVRGSEGNNLYIMQDSQTPITIIGGAGQDTMDLSHVQSANLKYITAIGIDTFVGGTLPVVGSQFNDTFSYGDQFASNDVLGGNGINTLDFSARSASSPMTIHFTTENSGTASSPTGDTLNFSDIHQVVGGAGNDTFIFDEPFGDQTIQGGGGVDMLDLSGMSSGNNLTVHFTNQTVSNGTHTITFSDIENVTTGAGDDTFYLHDLSTPHILDGGDGNDLLVLSGLTASQSVTVDLGAGGTADVVAQHMETVNTGAGNDHFLIGEQFSDLSIDGGSGSNTFDFSTLSTGHDLTVNFALGTVNVSGNTASIEFNNIQNITGGAGNDIFTFNGNFSEHTLDGGSGNDTLDLSGVPNGVNTVINASGGIFSGTTHTVANIETLIGGEGDNTFVFGDNFANTTVEGGTAGTDTLDFSLLTAGHQVTVDFTNNTAVQGAGTLTFSGIENSVGGAGDDTFILNNLTPRTLDGGDGNDTLDLSALGAGQNAVINLSNATYVGTTHTVSHMESIQTGAGNDRFVFGNQFDSTALDGGSGTNTLDFSNADSSHAIIANYLTHEVTHTSGSETIQFAANIAHIAGSDGNDQFIFGNGYGEHAVNGEGGTDTLDFSNLTVAISVHMNTGQAVSGGGADTVTFSNIENIRGGSGDDTYTWNANDSHSNTIVDVDGNDTYTGFGAGGFGADVIDDQGGVDYLDLSGFNQAQVTQWQSADLSGNDGLSDALIIHFATGDSLTIMNYFANSTASAGNGAVETFHFADGDLTFGDITYTP